MWAGPGMDAAQDKTQLLADYSALVRALLPQALGCVCYNRQGRVLWRDLPAQGIVFDPRYQAVLATILKDPTRAGRDGRVELEGAVAFIVPLLHAGATTMGALTILVDPARGELPHARCVEIVQPALRSLQRELGLRLRLLEGFRKLSVQAAEEQLLHKVEKLVHEREPCQHILVQVLELCRQYLDLGTAVLVLPELGIRIVQGSGLSGREAELLLDDLTQQGATQGGASGVWRSSDLYALPIHQAGRRVTGLLALAGWKNSEFSMRRRSRVARYICSHIEYVLDRDFDGLTGLMSWEVFEQELELACEDPERDAYAVMFLDIDQLHVINENFGRDFGDQILARFAALLRAHLPKQLMTRISGDSFAALLKGVDIEAARRLATGVAAAFRDVSEVRDGQTYRASVSIGIGPLLAEPEAASGVLGPAQVACKAAKERGRGRVEVYVPEDQSIIRRFDDIQLVGYIRSAIDNDQLTLLGQPINAIGEHNVRHYYEVLVRLVDEQGRLVLPADFLSAAERYHLMEELDRWVVGHTLGLLSGSVDQFEPGAVRIAINLSGQSLGSEAFLEYVQQRLAETGVNPAMLCFEITETVAMANSQRAQEFMQTLRQLGCHFSLDDFGTGLSSFAYLKLFPVDTLKIDGSFIRDLAENAVSQSMVAAIAEVARVMGLETVAEYVQDRPTLELLRKLGVTWAQGYLLGEPEPLTEKLDIIRMSPGELPYPRTAS